MGGIEKITVNGPFDSGDILVVDNYITVNDNAMSRTLITSDFFELPNGGAFAITVNSAVVNKNKRLEGAMVINIWNSNETLAAVGR